MRFCLMREDDIIFFKYIMFSEIGIAAKRAEGIKPDSQYPCMRFQSVLCDMSSNYHIFFV
jgi:hypothetical protein